MNLWGTFEFTCLSKDLSYKDYVFYLNKHRFGNKPVSEESYSLLNKVFNIEMEKDMQQQAKLPVGG